MSESEREIERKRERETKQCRGFGTMYYVIGRGTSFIFNFIVILLL